MESVEIYEPAVYRQLRKCGLQDADARELIQELLVVGQVAAFRGCTQHVDNGIVAIQRRTDHGDSFDTQSSGSQITAPAINDDTPGHDFDGNPNTSLSDVRSKLRILCWRHAGNPVRFGMKSQ